MKRKRFGVLLGTISCILLGVCSILLANRLVRAGNQNSYEKAVTRLESYRSESIAVGRKYNVSASTTIQQELLCLPYPAAFMGQITFDDSWGAARSENGSYSDTATRVHEGCDLMYQANVSGVVPVLSMTKGVVEQMGWLTLGGYRIGIRSSGGIYYYYAHLASYAEGLRVGTAVQAGTLLGFMGDTGYGEEGTSGKFAVHLHVGIYVNEITVNDLNLRQFGRDFFLFRGDDTNLQSTWTQISVNPYPYLMNMAK